MKQDWVTPQACWQFDLSERQEYHRQKLLDILAWAVQQVPFYQRLNLPLDELRMSSLAEILGSLPIVTKDMIRGHNPEFLASTSLPGYWSRTGGSTGEPTEVFYDQDKVRWGKQSVEFARNWWGLHSGQQRCFYIWGHSASLAPGLKGWKDRLSRPVKDLLRNRLRVDAYQMDRVSLSRYIQKLIRYQPEMIIGYTSTVYSLAQQYLDEGYTAARLGGLVGVIVTADPCYPFQAELIRSAFGAPVIEEYGSVEAGAIAYSHPDGTFRVLEDRLIVETPTTDGELPEVLVTDLSTRFQPLIRFAMADRCESPISPPLAGEGFRTIGKIDGRVYDSITGMNGQRLHGMALSHIVNATYPRTVRYRFHQNVDSHLRVEIQLHPDAKVEPQSEKRLLAYLHEMLGITLPIEVLYVKDFPPSKSGKFRWVVSEKR
ncbi:MAG: phenylacetate--CoA ligase family protein [Anaerolineales bacterium]|nr:phenylacetate--CoA ligase family protein [Anaerolineales bacterium]